MEFTLTNNQNYKLSFSEDKKLILRDSFGSKISPNFIKISDLDSLEAECLSEEALTLEKVEELVHNRLRFYAEHNCSAFTVHADTLKGKVTLVIGRSGLMGGGRNEDMQLSTVAIVAGIGITLVTGGWGGFIVGGAIAGGGSSRVSYCWDKTDNNPDPRKRYDDKEANRRMKIGAAGGAAGGAVGAYLAPAAGVVATTGQKIATALTSSSVTKLTEKGCEKATDDPANPTYKPITLGEAAATAISAPISVVVGERSHKT